MKFVDTSVLVAAASENHPFFDLSHRFLAQCRPDECAVSAHAFLETYAVLSRLPKSLGLKPSEAAAYVERISTRLKVYAITAAETQALVRSAPDRGVVGGRIYDALHARTAKKAGAEVLVTWNERNFIGLEDGLKTETPHVAALS